MNLGSEKQRDHDEKVVEIEIERLHDFKNHPFKVQADSQMKELQDSISKYGIDCMPSLGMMTINALACVDSVLIPVQAAYLLVKGLQQLIKTIGRVKKQLNPKLKIEGILLTMVDNRTNYARDISLMVYDTYSSSIKVFGTEIPMSVRASEVSVEREKPKWDDTITNRMLHWSYTPEQKEEVKKALAAGVPKATILTYFYPEVTVEKMRSYRKKQ